jgi:hypothetical protein
MLLEGFFSALQNNSSGNLPYSFDTHSIFFVNICKYMYVCMYVCMWVEYDRCLQSWWLLSQPHGGGNVSSYQASGRVRAGATGVGLFEGAAHGSSSERVSKAIHSIHILYVCMYVCIITMIPFHIFSTYASERRKAKTLNFSIAYGKTVHGYAL